MGGETGRRDWAGAGALLAAERRTEVPRATARGERVGGGAANYRGQERLDGIAQLAAEKLGGSSACCREVLLATDRR